MLGDRCEDKAALDFANEMKSISGGTSGVLLPAAFQGQWVDNLRSFMVLEASGMTTATMLNRTVTTSRVVSDPPVSWRAEASVEALRLQSFAETLSLEFVGWTRLDFMVRRPASFVALNGVTV